MIQPMSFAVPNSDHKMHTRAHCRLLKKKKEAKNARTRCVHQTLFNSISIKNTDGVKEFDYDFYFVWLQCTRRVICTQFEIKWPIETGQ